VISFRDEPLLYPSGAGKKGTFDEFGTMPGSLVCPAGSQEVWLYYVGWSRPSSLPYQWANGLAISKDGGGSFQPVLSSPLMASSYRYPYLHACPRVVRLGENEWVMWYAGGIEWHHQNGSASPVYVIMRADSRDGILWQPREGQTIAPMLNKECQSSASVIEHAGLYHMFFSYRDVTPSREEDVQYRIGYAWSRDLMDWNREDSQSGLQASCEGWDSVAVCYPHVVRCDDKVYLFYSGSKFGSAGFGFAELED
jgi:hypothetical protein